MRVLLAAIAFLLVVGIIVIAAQQATGTQSDLQDSDLVSLQSVQAGSKKLPPNAILIDAKACLKTNKPFKLEANSSATQGMALTLPKGAGTKDSSGKAFFKVHAKRAETFQAWARVHWRDSCSNSLQFKVGEGIAHTVGNDHVYKTWHWVKAGKHQLNAGDNTLAILEREDGVALDQILFTQNAELEPVGALTKEGAKIDVRRFADDFYRSPGHGIGAWDLKAGNWEMVFSFDPNRIPAQYSLQGSVEKGGEAATCFIKGKPWQGSHLSFSFFPKREGIYGAQIDWDAEQQKGLPICFILEGGAAFLEVGQEAENVRVALKDSLRLKQWHKVEIERWANVLQISLDEKVLYQDFERGTKGGQLGFQIQKGSAYFDDVRVEEILWQMDDGLKQQMSWQLSKGTQWFRQKKAGDVALVGKGGTITAELGGLPVNEVLLEEVVGFEGNSQLAGEFEPVNINEKVNKSIRHFRNVGAQKEALTSVSLQPERGEIQIKRMAVRYGFPTKETYVVGPYHFTRASVPDPSDYLDFTREEYEAMRNSGDYQKLKRRPKYRSIVGDPDSDRSLWHRTDGHWYVSQGQLFGGTGGSLLYTQEFVGDFEVDMRVKRGKTTARAAIELHAGFNQSHLILLTSETEVSKDELQRKNVLVLPWHKDTTEDFVKLKITARGNRISARWQDGEQKEMEVASMDGGEFWLNVSKGPVFFDDIEFTLPRESQTSGNYMFKLRETNWWRSGDEWKDHGGIACVLASNWVSLVAPHKTGVLWSKRKFAQDVHVAFNIEEHTDWYGWESYPSHEHYPFDNITIFLSKDANLLQGYKVVVNENKRYTTIYRNGESVARLNQASGFPMYYEGGHGPYFPRRNRVGVIKRGAHFSVIVNGKRVLTYEDDTPLEFNTVGIGGTNTHINFSNLEVVNLTDAPPN